MSEEGDFVSACSRGAVDAVRAALNSVSLRTIGSGLRAAASDGHVDVVALLLDDGRVVVDDSAKDGRTALYAACADGHLAVVRFLLARGASVDFTLSAPDTWVGATPLFVASKKGHVEIVRTLIEAGAKPDRAIGTYRDRSPLVMATYYGQTEVIVLLLGELARQDAQARSSLSPEAFTERMAERKRELSFCLLHACQERYMDLAQFFIDNVDADPYLLHPLKGLSAFHVACFRGQLEILKLMIARYGPPPKEWRAEPPKEKRGLASRKAWLRREGQDTGLEELCAEDMESTPLMLAVCADVRCSEVLLFLLDQCDLACMMEWRDLDGKTAFMLACEIGCHRCVQLLAAHGACFANDGELLDPQLCHPQVSRWLRFRQHWTPLQLCIEARLERQVREHIEAGADPLFAPAGTPAPVLLARTVMTPRVFGMPVCAKVQSLVDLSVSPWRPSLTTLYGKRFAQFLFFMFQVHNRLLQTEDDSLGVLPWELWAHILSFFRRHDVVHMYSQ